MAKKSYWTVSERPAGVGSICCGRSRLQRPFRRQEGRARPPGRGSSAMSATGLCRHDPSTVTGSEPAPRRRFTKTNPDRYDSDGDGDSDGALRSGRSLDPLDPRTRRSRRIRHRNRPRFRCPLLRPESERMLQPHAAPVTDAPTIGFGTDARTLNRRRRQRETPDPKSNLLRASCSTRTEKKPEPAPNPNRLRPEPEPASRTQTLSPGADLSSAISGAASAAVIVLDFGGSSWSFNLFRRSASRITSP